MVGLGLLVLAGLLGGSTSMQAVDRDGNVFDPNAYPVEITQQLMCQSCYAAVKEFGARITPKLQGLRKKLSREIVVYDAIDHFCEEAQFFDYTGFPPAFRKGCETFLDRYNEDSIVEDRLVAGGSIERQCKSVCREVCDGFSEEQRFSEYIVEASDRQPPASAEGRQPVEAQRRRMQPFPEGPAPDDPPSRVEL